MYIEQIDKNRIPRHIAIIMDGNGRWAQSRGMERTRGHQAGAQNVHDVMATAVKLGVEYLTLYTFSTENWNRPVDEVSTLMALLMEHLKEDLFMKHNARFRVIGDIQRLPANVVAAIRELEDCTKDNTATCMVLALSYSSRWELTAAMRQMASEVEAGTLRAADIDEAVVGQHLATAFMPDPDLLIRTGGEQRLSNYLLWQCAYSEFYFTDTFWPDFSEDEMCKAICDYQGRQRRFGKTGEQVQQSGGEGKTAEAANT